MAESETIWTLLPQGATKDTLRLVAIAGPRLRTDAEMGTLDQFEDWRRWPELVAAAQFSLSFAGGVTAEARPTGRVELEPDLWARVFPGSMRVRGFGFEDNSRREIASFPVAEVREFFLEGIREAAIIQPQAPARLVDLADDKLEILREVALPTRGQALETKLDSALAERRTQLVEEMRPVGLDLPKAMVPAASLLLAQRFLSRPPPLERPPKPPEFDFHQIVAALGDHPTLLRKLGIAIELECPRPADLAPDGTVALAVTGLPGKLLCPATRYTAGDGRFLAAGDDPALADGMLRLDEPAHFDVQQLDVDASISKLLRVVRLADAAGTESQLPGDDAELSEGKLPTLRSGGFSVIRHKRAETLGISLLRSAFLEDDLPKDETETVLGAEDLVRGYRLDVWDDDSKAWHSLHRRSVAYTDLEGRPLTEVEDEEGYVKATTGTTGDTENEKAARIYLHETLCGWEGWSLAAPRPGQALSEPAGPDDRERPVRPEQEAGDGVTLRSRSAVVPRTLPRLRYGRAYRFRLRIADLAAGGLDLDAADESHASEPDVYRRYDPVGAPAVVRRYLDTEGESLERLVIRSDFEVASDLYVRREHVTRALAKAEYQYRSTSERHLAAPKCSQLLAELHGVFDDAFGKGGKPGPAFWVAAREGGTFLDVWDEKRRTFTRPADVLLSTPTVKPPERDANVPAGSPLETGQQFARESASIDLPYLPDPAAGGIAFMGLPGLRADEPYIVEWKGKWPDVEPIRMILREGDGPPRVEEGNVVVSLPAGEIAHVRYSSFVDPDDLPLFAVWDLLDTDDEDDDRAELAAAAREIAKSSEHQMVTPARELALVHATQRPLAAPAVAQLTPVRGVGDTHVGLPGKLTCHAKTTARLEVLAAWTEPVDVVTEPVPREEPQSALPIAFDIERDDDEVELHAPEVALPELNLVGALDLRDVTKMLELRIESDTPDASIVKSLDKHLFLPSALSAPEPTPFTRVAEAGGLRAMLEDAPTRKLPQVAIDAIAELPDAARERLVAEVVRADRRLIGRHDFGDTRHRKVSYRARATTRYREYFHEAISRDTELITQTGAPLEVSIPSSARPAIPVIRQIVPSFSWETEVDQAREKVRHRRGGGLRVYLDRPWFSSGQGEQLAVLAGALTSDARRGAARHVLNLDAATEPYVTLWGGDPLWDGPSPGGPPATGAFPLAKLPRDGIALAEAPGGPTVAVAPHDVEFDEARGQWRCDIRLDTGDSHTPFVRLALARYQRESIDGVHISPLVRTDFVQPLPDRTCRIAIGSEGAEVTLEGVAPFNELGRASRVVRAVLEEQKAGAPEGLGWTPIVDPIVLEPSAAGDGPRIRWSGLVPMRGATGGAPRRLLVTEHEIFLADPDAAEIPPAEGEQTGRSSRIVYADAFAL